MSDDILQRIELSIDPGDIVTDVIVIAVTQRMDSFGQDIYVSTTPHTGFITMRGALEAALDDAKNPTFEYEEDEE